jgi:hypothetical protein
VADTNTIGKQKEAKGKNDMAADTQWIILRDILGDVRSEDIQYFFNGIRIDGDGMYAAYNESKNVFDIFVLFESAQGASLALDLDQELLKGPNGKALSKNVSIVQANFLEATLGMVAGFNLSGHNKSASETLHSLMESIPGLTLPTFYDLRSKYSSVLNTADFSVRPEMIAPRGKVNSKFSTSFDVFHQLSETCFFPSRSMKSFKPNDSLFEETSDCIRNLQYHLVSYGVDCSIQSKDITKQAKVFDWKRKYIDNALTLYSLIYDRLWLSSLSQK